MTNDFHFSLMKNLMKIFIVVKALNLIYPLGFVPKSYKYSIYYRYILPLNKCN